jgi:DNA-binding transcriptional LysR family regulator
MCPRYRQSGYHEIIVGLAKKAGFRPQIASEVDGVSTALALVERGLGIAILPRSESPSASNRVRCIPIGNPPVSIEFGVIWRRENMSPIVRWFIDHAVELSREKTEKRSPKLVA